MEKRFTLLVELPEGTASDLVRDIAQERRNLANRLEREYGLLSADILCGSREWCLYTLNTPRSFPHGVLLCQATYNDAQALGRFDLVITRSLVYSWSGTSAEELMARIEKVCRDLLQGVDFKS